MYEVFIDEMEVVVPVGLCPHERLAPQRLLVSVRARGALPIRPHDLSACIDYSLAVDRITAWHTEPHVDLLESLATELVDHLFRHDPKIDWVEVTLAKPDFYPNARAVGVRIAHSRDSYAARTAL
ncbi:dihydroneopterin aldolase [Hydrogenophilus thermoluteolus]|jgi:dihydroneopterin aldolase|uniref:dihydroneopterin aldolase n=1 Tax=Hydrogenophilaceae TaxID=206349 RepID=UPI00147686DF|nr:MULTISPECIES: dihydroneopterin aldolase [Hydrogenophilaceae]MBW7657626.1 dihydroneopterin aldolase [Hydrogenophilus thermoluteolus]HNQ49685.1 dihydroneopterin aldolase [Hydrogenophilus thermoluteolus]HNU20491.1 dihydroneopterin aldolase [Hydrogenophilus thermoluteolus]